MTDSFFVESNQKEYKQVPVGTHLGRCYRIIDLGTQKSTFDGNVKFLRKIRVYWELHGEDDQGQPLLTEKGEPLSIQRDYTLSFVDNATLRKEVENWFAEKIPAEDAHRYDLKKILDKWGMVNVIHNTTNGKLYSNVKSVSPVPNMISKHGLPEGHNPVQMFRLAAPNLELFETFPRGLKSKIFMSPEGQAMKKKHNLPDVPVYTNDKPAPAKQASGFDDMEDDIPF
jgi:hypothetical protein